ncbi:hypothetical protein J3458_004360 [Metarhizium acridum]|uniref:Uncharacterized protein n=1 Tax=Metarhizium acridum (strain CQMa 102) TaxID=655827 RepID=E9DVS1_METAQ|nr:uncharacterized protein MAC_01719 [Metarhizium acridum CQMa 102]EFY92118.1 hypothetical protein MAC_01719 [Metarhizium acridum CQMa 102]KAG8419502.1 hypothetical protein J3458_004360 [Metarhizium acridum]
MKFITILVAALAGTAFAAPYKRSVISKVTSVLGGVSGNTGASQLENQLQGVFGGSLAQIEQALGGVPLANKLLDLIHGGLTPAAAQAIGQGLAMVQSGLPINAVNAFLNQATNGAVANLENTLGASDLVGALTGVTGLVSGIVGSV